MTGKLPFGLTAPIIYVNPPVNRDLGLVEAVYRLTEKRPRQARDLGLPED